MGAAMGDAFVRPQLRVILPMKYSMQYVSPLSGLSRHIGGQLFRSHI
jgi:hypothetical protein